MFFMVICGREKGIESFEGFFIFGLEWMIQGVTVVLLQEVLVTIAGVVAETKNSPCSTPLR